MNKARFETCPNCGGTTFAEIASDKQECVYCGTVLALPEVEQTGPSETVTCYRCGFDNPRGAQYCNRCGASLVGAAAIFGRLKANLALTSIAVTVLGSLFIPFLGTIGGLILAYRARKQAREGKGSESLARTAILLGWCFLALGLLPLCLVLFSSGAQVGYSLCDMLVDGVLDAMPWR